MDAEPLVWSSRSGRDDDPDVACDLAGHFWAEVRHVGDRWLLVIWDYEDQPVLRGDAESREGAQAAVEGWNRWVVTSDRDPGQD